jgi:lysophosphatidylcholine acyltransferase/lyso-PAF acetyltransferase
LVALALAPGASFIAKSGVRRAPLVGRIADELGCVFVERDRTNEGGGGRGTDGAAAVLARLRTLHTTPEQLRRPLWIFPEGTTTNGAFLLQFKRGAFLSGDAVQPVILRYGGRNGFSPSFESIDAGRSILLLLSQWSNSCEVMMMPIYQPIAPECANPALFAAGVRTAMLRASGLQESSAGLRYVCISHSACSPSIELQI